MTERMDKSITKLQSGCRGQAGLRFKQLLCSHATGVVKEGIIMSKINKVFFIIYSIIFVLLIGILIYINFFNSKIDFISNKHLVACIFAFLLGLIKMLTRNENSHGLNFYKKAYSHLIKDSFSDNKKQLAKLLKALKLYNDDKFQKALSILSDLEAECNTTNEKYSVYLFEAFIHTD